MDVEKAYGDRLERLRSLKYRYDPTNFLRLNANIEPSTWKWADRGRGLVAD